MIHKAMCAAMDEITAISKDRTNTQQNFKFRGIDDVYNELHGILAKHKIFTVPEVLEDKVEERTSSKGNALIYRVLRMKYTFYSEDGSNISCVVIGEGMDSGDKAANKAMSIAHKYALFQTFLIPTEDEKDPDGESHQVAPKPAGPKEPSADNGRCSKAQASAIHAMLNKMGIVTDNERYEWVKTCLNRSEAPTSMYDLTKVEAGTVIEAIQKGRS